MKLFVFKMLFISQINSFQDQLWDLLPNILSSATDFVENFSYLAEILGKVLLEQRDLRLIVLSSLRSALRCALQPDATAAKKVIHSI